jgi:uncharacterized protein
MENARVIGQIVSVQGFRVKVELLPEAKSAMRATLDGVQLAVAINAFLTFSLGAGKVVIGIITDLEAKETYDPSSGDDLTLDLSKPRRIASVQLLGTIEFDTEAAVFSPGITILPTLDTQAEIGSPDVLRALFEVPPRRNKPDGHEGDDFDFDLCVGVPTGQPSNVAKASFNDLFSRPLAIVGNTGSGKSYTVSTLVQKAMQALKEKGNEPHIFILDVNGEYDRAFGIKEGIGHKPDRLYLNGKEFGIPIWFFNAGEVCTWLSASEQTQEPVLKDWWAIAKAQEEGSHTAQDTNSIRHAITKLTAFIQTLDSQRPIKKTCMHYLRIIESYLDGRNTTSLPILALAMEEHAGNLTGPIDWAPPLNEAVIREGAQSLIDELKVALSEEHVLGTLSATTADSPRYISKARLVDPTLLDGATPPEDAGRIESHLTTLKLRLKTRLDDPRWRAFLNYDDDPTKMTSLSEWMQGLGLGKLEGPKVSVINLSMLSHEVLPYACSVIGRILLEARENLAAAARYRHPWVLVLEEAHNYARPARLDEDRGQTLSRLAFERIAKEGRKFGISLVIASQRPSEISQTIISQCANFISHRLQNPDDIDHFRRIIPMQARRLLDQVTILASGEAIVFGSAFHVPTRVQFDRPEPGPYSQTAAPYHEWRSEKAPFPLDEVIDAWGLATTPDSTEAD